MSSSIQPSDCDNYIEIWVDTTSVSSASTTGIYLVDDAVVSGSSNEGTPTLDTCVPASTSLCWSIVNVDPNSSATLSIQNFSSSPAWGPNGTPQQINSTTWTGSIAAAAGYTITLTINQGNGQIITTTVNPSISIPTTTARKVR